MHINQLQNSSKSGWFQCVSSHAADGSGGQWKERLTVALVQQMGGTDMPLSLPPPSDSCISQNSRLANIEATVKFEKSDRLSVWMFRNRIKSDVVRTAE